MINRVTLLGRLGHDVELRYTATTGTPVAKLRIATDGSYRNAEGDRVEATDWHQVIAYGKVAELCADRIGKGSLVYVEGALKTRRWVDQGDITHYVTEVVCRCIRFLDFRHADEPGAPDAPETTTEATTETF